MKKFQSERGIVWQTTIPYTPEQNGVAERINRTILETAKSILPFAKLDKSFWAEAVSTAVYIRNRNLPSNDSVAPYEKWYGTNPDVSNLCIFGCRVMVHVPREKRKKLDAKLNSCVFVGCPDHKKGYKLYESVTRSMVISRDVNILESQLLKDSFLVTEL